MTVMNSNSISGVYVQVVKSPSMLDMYARRMESTRARGQGCRRGQLRSSGVSTGPLPTIYVPSIYSILV